MPTQEEQQSTLQSNRFQARHALGQKKYEKSTARFTPIPTPPKKDFSNSSERDSYRRARFSSNQLENQFFQNAREKEKGKKEEAQSEESAPEENPSDPVENLKQGQRLRLFERAIKQRLLKQRAIEAKGSEEEEDKREEAKKFAKAAAKRGIMFAVNFLVSALNIATVGVAFLIDAIFYLFCLGWLNLEMFYGTYIAKGKSKYISPISWSPIPMPIDKNAIFLQGVIIFADIALALAFLVMMFGSFCILHDYIFFLSSPLQIGIALANGGEGMCLGAIIPTLLGL